MKRILMMGLGAAIYANVAHGASLLHCYVKTNCGDGAGFSTIETMDYVASVGGYVSDITIPLNMNISCSKEGATFSHWAVSLSDGSTPSSPVAYPGKPYNPKGCSGNRNLILTAVYVSNSITTSQPYVETQLGLKQDEIPAANTAGVGAGTTVVTYTAQSGEIGERALFTGGEYTAGTDADKLITASALNTAFTTLPTTDTTTLECANQNDGCTLWAIVDQTAYGIVCRPAGETAQLASDCCSGVFSYELSDGGGVCGCATDNDCAANWTCNNNGLCVLSR